jgi:hypothetical protein
MSAIEFDARVTNGTIEIPSAHRGVLQGEVHVIVYPQSNSASHSKIDDLLSHPLAVPGFQRLTRDEAHERA